MADLLSDISAERKEVILARAEQLIREERARHVAPASTRDVGGTAAAVLIGAAIAIALIVWVIVT